MQKILLAAVKKYKKYDDIEEIIDEFNLSRSRLDYKLSQCSWEKWRISLAIGYASKKKIFCFPWMNSLLLFDCMNNSAVYYFFEKLKKEGAIIILPTSRKENLKSVADKIIEIGGKRFEHTISDIEYYKKQ